ncbi:ABC transporter permease [Ferrovibrio sp.]|uniref:ABC transporter permease n=1 Tax=Ferrovibrio sp. TaxID=1917215 RepID=UPI0035B4F18C
MAASEEYQAGRRRFLQFAETRWIGWGLVVILVGLWEFATAANWISIPALPRPTAIAERAWLELTRGTLLKESATTLRLMFIGYGTSAVIAIAIGVLIGRLRVAWALLEPLTELIRPIPISAAVPILILFLGIDDGLKITAVFWGSFFPIMMNTYAGIRAVPPTLKDTGRTFGVSTLKATLLIALPYALPSILVGMRIALSLSLIVSVFSEMIAGNSGIGYVIVQSQQTLSVDRLYVAIILLASIGYLLNTLFLRLEATVTPWHVANIQAADNGK